MERLPLNGYSCDLGGGARRFVTRLHVARSWGLIYMAAIIMYQ
jgi:hypothetical protein